MWNQVHLDRLKQDHTYYIFDPNDQREDNDEVYIQYPDSTGMIFDVAVVHMLTPSENTSQHNVFFDVLDEQYNPLRNVTMLCENTGNLRQEVVLDKGSNEPGGNVPVFWGDTYCISVRGDLPSARVCNLHTRLPDLGEGSTSGHHSYYIVFVRRLRKGSTKPPIDPPSDMVQIPKNVFSEIQLTVTYLKRANLDSAEKIARLELLLTPISSS